MPEGLELVGLVNKILQLSEPNFKKTGVGADVVEWTDKELQPVIDRPLEAPISCSTLKSLVTLWEEGIAGGEPAKQFMHVVDPFTVEVIASQCDKYARRQVFAKCSYPSGSCPAFTFNRWMAPEDFLIQVQQGFQRVKIQHDDESMARDLDYILEVASKITAESTVEHQDDGISQRVAVRQGVQLKEERVLRPRVNLAPFRTFAEIDQPISTFIFRAKLTGESVLLAIFEGDGGRWRLAATEEIKRWLADEIPSVSIVG